MSSSPAVSKETILIIDDQEQNRVILHTLLTMTGHEVVSASSGAEALQRLEACTPDLILLDVLMPDVNGIDVCRKIKANALWVDVPVIFLSAADDKNLIVEALECGGVDYVTKPFNKAELLSRVRTHLALRRAREELRHLAEDKDELLGILTHDLGNHLSGVRMSAAVLEKQIGDLPKQCAPVVLNIVNSTEVMTTFVREFLANQSAERLQVNIAPTDLQPLLEEAVARHTLIAEAKKIALSLEFFAAPVHAHADPEALASVLDNLLSNAIKFTPEGRRVSVTATGGSREWTTFSVRDEGPGFTAEDQQKMFRRYGRLSARPTGGEHSTGLGLSIVKRLVETLNGRIVVESGEGKGACITVSLPAATEAVRA